MSADTNDNSRIAFDDLQSELGRVDELTDRVRVAGFALAEPLLAAREAQLTREVARTAKRYGARSPLVARREADRAESAARMRLFNEELSRARVARPNPNDGEAAIWGRVANDGEPVAGFTVSALADGERQAFACTDELGAFMLMIAPDVAVQVSVKTEDGEEVHRDRDAAALREGEAQYREIDLTRGIEAPCPEPPGGEPPVEPDGFAMVQLVGQPEATVRSVLKNLGLALGQRDEQLAEDQVGLVLKHEPAAGDIVRAGDAINLVIGVGNRLPVPDLVGLTPDAAERLLKESGLSIGVLTRVAVGRERVGIVLDQRPPSGARVERGTPVDVSVSVARGGDGEIPGVLTERVQQVAAIAEKRVREDGIFTELRDGQLARTLQRVGVTNLKSLTELLNKERADLRDLFDVRTLRDTDRIIAALKAGLREIGGDE